MDNEFLDENLERNEEYDGMESEENLRYEILTTMFPNYDSVSDRNELIGDLMDSYDE